MADEKKPDTSNYIEHLRLVHLTLVLTCLISIVASISQEESSAKRAYNQIKVLRGLKDRWGDGKWIDGIKVQRSSGAAEGSVAADNEPPQKWIFRRSVGFAQSNGEPLDLRGISFDQLTHAEQAWDILRTISQTIKPTEVHDGWLFVLGVTPSQIHVNGGSALKLDGTADSKQGLNLADEASWYQRELFLEAPRWKKGETGDFLRKREDASYFIRLHVAERDRVWIFPADIQKESFDALGQLMDKIVPLGFAAGTFKETFPDLVELSKHLTDVPIEQLQAHFEEESKRAVDKVELPGFKLPTDELAYVGTTLIFALAFYSFAVFRDFRFRVSPGDKAWDVAWIGISREAWSKVIFWVSTMLPLGTAVLLIKRGANLSLLWQAFTFVGTVVAFGLVAVGIFLSWRALQQAERVPPAAEPRQSQFNH